MILFNEHKCMDICLKNTSPYVRLAVEDLRNDFARRSAYGVKPQLVEQESDACIVIEENTMPNCDPVTAEGFAIKSQGNIIRISADGYLGTMWGIYTFCERYLGVDPCYLFNDLEIQKVATLEAESIDVQETPNGFRFRGVFINDEDLLEGWKTGGGPRFLDYPYYNKTVAPEVMEMIVETVLRCRLNLIIPATLVDVDNPPEKLLTDCVAKRGIYLSQHHLEPVGLSHFTMENYCKKYNKTGDYSYIKYPELLEGAWNHYAKLWSEYDNVVWQVGLRGKADRPVWEEEIPNEKELAEFGVFISNAINKQCQIVKAQTGGKAKHFTSTLWMEGSMLMEKGLLNVDKDVCMVFSDNGTNQMYGNEYHRIPRKNDKKYGIYYHLQYNDLGPHLAPQTGLDKLCYNIKKAYDNNDRDYLIVNVSNIREFTFELDGLAKLLWDTQGFDKEAYTAQYCQRVYGQKAERAKAYIQEYFDVMPCLENGQLANIYAKYFNYFYEEESPGVKNFVLKEGLVLKEGKEVIIGSFFRDIDLTFLRDMYTQLKTAEAAYLQLAERFADLGGECAPAVMLHTQVKWTLYCVTLAKIYGWYNRLFEAKLQWNQGNEEGAKTSVESAIQTLEDYLTFRSCAEYGDFANWYREEIKFDTEGCLRRTKALLEKLQAV